MTVKKAQQLARQARQHGYYRPSTTTAYVFCPQCREQIDTEFSAMDAKRVFKLLDAAVIDHLKYDGCARV